MKDEKNNRNHWLGDRRFWAMFYYMDLDSAEAADAVECIEPFFGVTAGAVHSFFKEHFVCDPHRAGEEGFPFVELEFPGGFSLRVEFGEDGEYLRLLHEKWSESISLCWTGAASTPPIFRWREFESIVRQFENVSGALNKNSAFLLLFFACHAEPSERPAMREGFESAWRESGLVHAHVIPELADRVFVHLAKNAWTERRERYAAELAVFLDAVGAGAGQDNRQM